MFTFAYSVTIKKTRH